jgi:Cdc6-like AAA superfamily ATPase
MQSLKTKFDPFRFCRNIGVKKMGTYSVKASVDNDGKSWRVLYQISELKDNEPSELSLGNIFDSLKSACEKLLRDLEAKLEDAQKIEAVKKEIEFLIQTQSKQKRR